MKELYQLFVNILKVKNSRLKALLQNKKLRAWALCGAQALGFQLF